MYIKVQKNPSMDFSGHDGFLRIVFDYTVNLAISINYQPLCKRKRITRQSGDKNRIPAGLALCEWPIVQVEISYITTHILLYYVYFYIKLAVFRSFTRALSEHRDKSGIQVGTLCYIKF